MLTPACSLATTALSLTLPLRFVRRALRMAASCSSPFKPEGVAIAVCLCLSIVLVFASLLIVPRTASPVTVKLLVDPDQTFVRSFSPLTSLWNVLRMIETEQGQCASFGLAFLLITHFPDQASLRDGLLRRMA